LGISQNSVILFESDGRRKALISCFFLKIGEGKLKPERRRKGGGAMKGRVVCFLVVLVLGFTGSAMGEGPVAVSPGGEGSIAVIGQECPTFSWSQVEGVISYRLKVFDMVGGILGSYEAMEKMREPVVSVEIKAPALSWTPSQEECLVSGEKYVWYVGAVGSDGVERWSEGRGFEVNAGVSLGVRDAVKETVNQYLTKEWISTASYQEVKESIASQVAKEVKGVGGGGVVASQTPRALGVEGPSNTYYGTNAGANLGTNTTGADTFIGANAGYSNNNGVGNTFLGNAAGYANTTGTHNTIVGETAGYNTTGAGDNTFVGQAAGYNNTAQSNTFLGHSAGYHNTSGANNTMVGDLAGFNTTGAGDNTFVGQAAGYNNTAGGNSFFGRDAGKANTTASGNAFFGRSAGAANTTATGQSFFGYQAGLATTGAYNTFLGYQTGYVTTTGVGNVFVGARAGDANNAGNNNDFFGFDTGGANTTGSGNSFFGDWAGSSNTTGSFNSFFGKESGILNSTGSYNVFLGYQAGYSEPGSNKLYIANSDTSTPLIYGEFDNQIVTINGKLGIGTTTPQQKIDLGGGMLTLNGADTTGAMPPGLSSQTWEPGRIDFGYGGSGGGNLEAYSKGHARAGQFKFIYGGGPTMGSVIYTHYDGTTWLDMMWLTYDGQLHMAGGAYTDGHSWFSSSSRAYKENIRDLSVDEAMDTLKELSPVKFSYKADSKETHVGFIAEDVPELVATKDRKGMSPMDVVAVLTKVVQEQQKVIEKQQNVAEEQQKTIAELSDKLKKLERNLK
jgi:hypothetical protein